MRTDAEVAANDHTAGIWRNLGRQGPRGICEKTRQPQARRRVD